MCFYIKIQKMKDRTQTSLVRWAQKISGTGIMGIFFRIFFDFKIYNKEKVKNLSGPLLIISNHRYFLDSFALGAALPFTSKLYPLRIMGETKKFRGSAMEFLRKIGVIKLVYFLFGVLPAIRGQELEISLAKPLQILNKGEVVFLHPEGRVIKEKEIGQFKRGASFLANQTKVDILPVVFEIGRKKFRRTYSVKFGDTFKLPEGLSLEQGAEYMRNIVFNLYESLP